MMALEDAWRCVHCGLCLTACPMREAWPPYGEVGTPRGKVSMVQGYLMGVFGRDPNLEEEFWYRCSLCERCHQFCPLHLRISGMVLGMRQRLLEDGRVPQVARRALMSLHRYGNPWHQPPESRGEWARGLPLKVSGDGNGAEVLLYVGCFGSYDPRGQKMARALAEVLLASGVEFSILGPEELCCGREAYSLGEKGLLEWLRERNLEIFSRYRVRKVVTLSPHCYDAFRNLYPPFAEVEHYSVVLAKLMREGRLPLKGSQGEKVVYHDPCHLGRRNAIYDEPRQVLRAMGFKLLELPHSRQMAFCCESGGGKMWLPSPGVPMGPKKILQEAETLGADAVVTSCPFCVAALEAASGSLEILDLAELVKRVWDQR